MNLLRFPVSPLISYMYMYKSHSYKVSYIENTTLQGYSGKRPTKEPQHFAAFSIDGDGTKKEVRPTKHTLDTELHQLSICFTQECNYTCAHCNSHVSLTNDELHGFSNSFLSKVLEFCSVYKNVVKPKKVLLNLFGGELTLLPMDTLVNSTKKVISVLGKDTIASLQFITNLYRPESYVGQFLDSLESLPVNVIVSFHDSILTTVHARQKFFSKVLKLRLYEAFSNKESSLTVNTTFSADNQWMSVPLGVLSLKYPFMCVNTLLLQQPDKDGFTFRFTNGRFLGPKNLGIYKYNDKPINGYVCNGLAAVQVYQVKDLLVVEPQCLNSKVVTCDGNKAFIRKPISSVTTEDLVLACNYVALPAKCSLVYPCTPCSKVTAMESHTADNLNIRYSTVVEQGS